MSMYNLVSFAGIFIVMGLAWCMSADRRCVNYRLIGWGLLFQAVIAGFIFVFPPGANLFLWLNGIAVKVMESSTAGAEFVFGRLASPPGAEDSLGFFLAFQGLPSIIFFSALMAILYYVGVMQRIIQFFARLFSRLMRVSGAESLCASSNIFEIGRAHV